MDEGASVSERRRRGGGVGGKPPRFEPIKESGARRSPRRINQKPRKRSRERGRFQETCSSREASRVLSLP
jgi:hypothetical protein